MGKLIVLSTGSTGPCDNKKTVKCRNVHLDHASEDASIFILITLAHTCIKIKPSDSKSCQQTGQLKLDSYLYESGRSKRVHTEYTSRAHAGRKCTLWLHLMTVKFEPFGPFNLGFQDRPKLQCSTWSMSHGLWVGVGHRLGSVQLWSEFEKRVFTRCTWSKIGEIRYQTY